jgi:hypothetical protein
MGGKTSTSTQGVSIPPAVLAQYQAVNSAATQTAATPFQQYGGQFVSPVNAQQSAGIAGTNAAANEAQPYYGAATGTLEGAQSGVNPINQSATGLAAASAGPVNAQPLTGDQINSYLSPYLGDVLGSTSALLNQNNQQQQAGQLGTAIQSGAFGGDRTGIAAANLEQQQNLSNANIYSGIANQGYLNAQGVAQQQQGVNLEAGQANRAALGSAASNLSGIGQTAYGEGANTATTLAGLGVGAQSAGLQGAQAQIGAGTLQQQTQQAQDTAQYNQFLQQQSYPFQVDQFLANIAEGTGALSGSTTTTQQPGGFFSDRRLKHDVKKIGELYDGQHIVSYKMHGDPRTRIGLIAQDVEKKRPEAVGLAAGYKIVDYGKATEEAANRGHFYSGGVVPIRAGLASGGGAVWEAGAFADGGSPYGGSDTNYDLGSILAAQAQIYAPSKNQRQIPNQGANHQLAVASGSPTPPPSGSSNVNQAIGLGQKGYQAYKHFTTPTTPPPSGGGVPPTPSLPPAADSSYFTPQAAAADSPGLGGGVPPTPSLPPAADSSYFTPQAAAADSPGLGAGAAETAAPAAADVAAPAAADAAGVGAGAAVDAGVETTAALAAEYAAADSAVALLAAKRGGRIRGKLAAGGTPYESGATGTPYQDENSTLIVPDDENSTKLLTAGPLKKQPTGLQTAMSLGQPDTASSAIGGMFSNSALARGGGVEGRRGYDDGGDVAQTADPDMLPEQTVESARPPPIEYTGGVSNTDAPPMRTSAPKAADTGVTAGAETPKDHWWKHAENVVPLLSGLAAMGTAPTRSWGTALAAGLGAGAQSYIPTQEGLATANLTRQKGRSEGYEADLMQAANNVAIPMLNGVRAPSALAPPAAMPGGGATPGSAPYRPTPQSPPQATPQGTAQAPTLAQQLRVKYQNPPLTPDDAQKLQQSQYLSAATKNPAWVAAAQQGPTNRVTQTDYANKQDARSNYDAAVQTYHATKDTNPAIAASAAATADAYQQYTDDEPMVGAGGVQLNKRTKEPYIGSEAQRLSPDAYTQLNDQMMQKDTIPAGDPNDPGKTIQIPHYKRLGFDTPAQAIAAVIPAGVPDVPGRAAQRPDVGSPMAGAPPRPTIRPTVGAPPVTAAQPAAQPARPGQRQLPSTSVLPAPVAAKAFSDAKFFPSKQANQPGTTFGSATGINADAEAKRKVELQAVASDVSESSGAALQYAAAAKNILDSKGAPVTGFYGPYAKILSSIAGTANASNYEEVSKQLINLAVQAGKSNFPNATQKEVGIQLEQASPATNQQGPALRRLLDETMRINKYALDSATLANDYIDKGGTALRFGAWNQAYHPRAEAVNQRTAPPAAIAHLKSHPELADQFHQYYGYLPQ